MNLMKLLKVGNSVKEGKTVLGKYKLTQQSLLPKFASTTRPSRSVEEARVPVTEEKPRRAIFPEPRSATPPAPLAEAKPALKLLTNVSQKKTEEPSVPKAEPPPVPEPAIVRHPLGAEKTQKIATGTVLKRVENEEVSTTTIGITTRIKNKIFRMAGKLWPARSRRKNRAVPFQTEWTLEKIKVARNDLSDADLVVVARKSAAPKTKPKPGIAEGGDGKHHGLRWVKMTARLFKRTSPFEKSAEEVQTEAAHRSELAGRI